MNILLVYITNSGGTYETAKIIREVLTQKGHQVTLKKTVETDPNELANYDLFLLGSPSWDWTDESGKRFEGQPHETMKALMEQIKGINNLQGKNCAIFGLGDSSYTYLCGSVDHMEKFTDDVQAHRVIDSLRVDSYYFDLDNNNAKIHSWAEELANKLQ